jgi:AraC-like DNA-binding protein/ligand-binding sensor protein
MSKNINALFNGDKINLECLNYILDLYYNSVKLSVFALDENGNKIFSKGEGPLLCKFIKYYNKDCNCEKQYIFAGKMSEKIGEDYTFACNDGLIFFTVPIINEFIFKGCMVCGPMLLDYPDESLVDGILDHNKIPLCMREKVVKYLGNIPVVQASRVKYLSKNLYILTEYFMNEEKVILQERKEKNYQQSKIGEIIQEIKANNHEIAIYPYEKEKELITKVKNGDIIGAKAILNDILGIIFFNSGGNIEIIKARTLELCILLSRASIEGGAALDKTFVLNYEFTYKLSKINNIEDLSYWTMKVLDKFGENVFNLEQHKNANIIKRSLNYINDNYMLNITLDSVAKYVYLNTSYFSTLFKKEIGTGFADYLNRVRIEQSKQLLKNRNNSILDVALAVGFEDQSYYSKVFKKFTGITPKMYKSKV